jgi:hypothetical protein
MNQIEKLRVLLPHWIEHNLGHGEECRKWSAIAREEGQQKVAEHIDEAMKAMVKANELLDMALREAGGPVHENGSGHNHNHQHNHHHKH